jgi:hypothetical protein
VIAGEAVEAAADPSAALPAKEEVTQGTLHQLARATSVRPRVAESGNEQTEEPGYLQRLLKPSDGLEPSTPSLPWKFGNLMRVHPRTFASTFVLQICR